MVTEAIPVSGVEISPESVTLQPEESSPLTAVITPDNATFKDVSWSIGDPSIATVDDTGRVTAVAPGTTKVTVTAADGSKSGEAGIQVIAGVTSSVYLSDLNWNSAVVGYGSIVKDKSVNGAVITLKGPDGANISYSKGISVNAITTINYDISGKGFQRFQAYVGNDMDDTRSGKIQFQVKLDGVVAYDSGILDKSKNMLPLQFVDIDVTGKHELQLGILDGGDGNGHDHGDFGDAKFIGEWATNDAKLASIAVDTVPLAGFEPRVLNYKVIVPTGTTVVPNVTVTTGSPKASYSIIPASAIPGTTKIQVTAENGSVKTYTLNVGYLSILAGYQLDSDGYQLTIGDTHQTTVSAKYEDGSTEDITAVSSFESSNLQIVQVNAQGLVTGIGEGTAVIKVTTPDHTEKIITVVVASESIYVPVSEVTLDKNTLFLDAQATGQLTAAVTPADATNQKIVWLTDNGAVALVNSQGLVTAVSNGTATITVTTVDGHKTATSEVQVVTTPVPVIGVSLDTDEISLNIGDTKPLVAIVEPEEATNKNVVWSSSNENIATVDIRGVVTAIAPGIAMITATTVDGEFTAGASVTVMSEDYEQFIIIPEGDNLKRENGLEVAVQVNPKEGTSGHEGNEFIVFQLLKGTEPAGIMALKKDLTSSEELTVFFHVQDPENELYRVKVFVLDHFDSDASAPISLAVPIDLN